MSNLRALKNQANDVGQANKLCNSMSSLSTVKTLIYSKKLKIIKEKLLILGGIIFEIDENFLPMKKEKKTFAFFYDFDFCGDFNDHQNKNVISVGKKGKTPVKTNDLKSLTDFTLEPIGEKYN